MLMAITMEEETNYMTWHLDTGCSNHMLRNKNLVQGFDSSRKTKVKQRRLVNFDMILDNAIDGHGEIVHYAMLIDIELDAFQVALKKQVWKDSMLEELSSI